MLKQYPARIFLLPAKEAPVVVIIRRKPSKLFHLIRWNTSTDQLEHGSWFRGKLYPNRCDVSFDGEWMIYLAMGSKGETWNGICRLPFLRTFVESENNGTWNGGGYWRDKRTVMLNQWTPCKGSSPFKYSQLNREFGSEDLGVFYPRLQRDGWVRRGENYGSNRQIKTIKKYMVACDGDDGWQIQPTRQHPVLSMRYTGYLEHGYTFCYSLDGYPNIVDEEVTSACWDSLGQLFVARKGVVSRYSLSDLKQGKPATSIDFNEMNESDKET
jgi:hypothetical protein